MNSWVEVSEGNLAWNYHALQRAIGRETGVLAVVKANAYGHGAALCSAVLAEAGARWLGVTCATEGVLVRGALEAAGFGEESRRAPTILLMCGFLLADVEMIRRYDLTPVIWTAEQVDWLCTGEGRAWGLGEGQTRGPRVHVEIDTGMGRQGVLPGEELGRLLGYMAKRGLRLDGVFTHFCSSEVGGSELTQLQERRFEQAVAQVGEMGLRPEWVHAGNSATVENPAQDAPWLVELAKSVGAKAMVRTGLALYGYCLPVEWGKTVEGLCHVRAELKPVMSWKAHVLAVRELLPGETVGYNATYTAERPMRVALLPVGYADGLRRELSSTNERAGGWAMVRGERAHILGRVSMNLTVVDVTEIEGVAAGDAALVLGEGVSADDHARLADTIAYEILCGVHPCG